MKTLIAVPCMDFTPVGFTHSLAVLKKEGEVTLSMMSGSLVYESRNKLAKQALSMGADYILWLDSDMVFPDDTLIRMLEHMKDKEIVTGLYFRRAAPFTPVLLKSYKEKETIIEWEEYPDYPKDSVFEVAGMGFGCVMMRTDLLYDLGLNYQAWFQPIKNCGEDMSFCFRAKELGHKIYCDSTIKCGHVGHMVIDENIWETMK